MKRCAWHKCNRAFEPATGRDKFCGPACRRNRGAWKERRGAPLVDMLIEDRFDEVVEARRQLIEEIRREIAATD